MNEFKPIPQPYTPVQRNIHGWVLRSLNLPPGKVIAMENDPTAPRRIVIVMQSMDYIPASSIGYIDMEVIHAPKYQGMERTVVNNILYNI